MQTRLRPAALASYRAASAAKNRPSGSDTGSGMAVTTPMLSVTCTSRPVTTIGSEAWKLAELTFEDCFVPDSAVMGKVGEGFRIAMESLTDGRMAVATSAVINTGRMRYVWVTLIPMLFVTITTLTAGWLNK